jgi:hypothetical protein
MSEPGSAARAREDYERWHARQKAEADARTARSITELRESPGPLDRFVYDSALWISLIAFVVAPVMVVIALAG